MFGVKTVEDVDVYCFGQTLYELMYGQCLQGPFLKSMPDKCPSDLGTWLHLWFYCMQTCLSEKM